MPKNYKSQETGTPYFLTFTIIEWLNVLTKPVYMNILWDSLQYCRKEKGMRLYAFVFMTNHIHLIISAEKENIKLWEIIRDYKKFTAQKIIQEMQKNETRTWILDIMRKAGEKNKANTQYQFWIQDDGAQEIHSNTFFHQKANYIHANPVRAEIVEQPENYIWSSAKYYHSGDFTCIDSME